MLKIKIKIPNLQQQEQLYKRKKYYRFCSFSRKLDSLSNIIALFQKTLDRIRICGASY